MIVVVESRTASTLNLGSPLGVLGTGKTIRRPITVAFLEQVEDSLNEFQRLGLLSWRLESEDTNFLPAQALATKTQGPLHLWVDARRGSDTAVGSKSAPLSSLVEAESRIPDIVAHPVVIHVAPHSIAEDGYIPPEFRERVYHHSVDIVADSGGTHNDGFNELLTGTAQAGTTHVQLVSDTPLVEDEFRGKTIEITSGDNRGFRRTIKSNTTSEISFCQLFGSLSPGVSFRILEPITVIDVARLEPQGRWFVAKGNVKSINYGFKSNYEVHPSINFVNFIFNPAPFVYAIHSHPVRVFGCEVNDSGSFWGFFEGHFAAGIDRVFGPPGGEPGQVYEELADIGQRLANVSPRAWVGWGIYSNVIFVSREAKIGGCWLYAFVGPRLVSLSSNVELRGGNCYASGVRAIGGRLAVNGKVYLPDDQITITNVDDGGAAASALGPDSEIYIEEAILSAPTNGVGLRVIEGAVGTIAGTTQILADLGVQLNRSSRIYYNSGAVVTATTEIEVGEGTPVQAQFSVDLSNYGDFVISADGSTIIRVDRR